MEKNKKDCKIVQDLLPNYVEDLTDEVTNEYIKEHIETCMECRNALENVNTEIEVEELNQDREIQYLKKVRNKVRRTIMTAVLFVIMIASGFVWYSYISAKIQINNYTFLRATYVLESEEGTKDGKLYCTLIAMLDQKGICKSVRVIEKGYKEESINQQYKLINSVMDNRTNVMIVDDEIHYNTNILNGKTKKEVEKYWGENYRSVNLEET